MNCWVSKFVSEGICGMPECTCGDGVGGGYWAVRDSQIHVTQSVKGLQRFMRA